MNEDNERVRLLAIFHYVVAGFAALLSFFPLLYSIVGGFLLYAAHHPGPGNQEPPPAFLGWIFTMAICILIAGGCLSRRKAFSSVLVVACVECFFIPFGTILGVFTIVALSRESVRALFSTGQSRA